MTFTAVVKWGVFLNPLDQHAFWSVSQGDRISDYDSDFWTLGDALRDFLARVVYPAAQKKEP